MLVCALWVEGRDTSASLLLLYESHAIQAYTYRKTGSCDIVSPSPLPWESSSAPSCSSSSAQSCLLSCLVPGAGPALAARTLPHPDPFHQPASAAVAPLLTLHPTPQPPEPASQDPAARAPALPADLPAYLPHFSGGSGGQIAGGLLWR